MDKSEMSTKELIDLINNHAAAALRGVELDTDDAITEVEKRIEERGEHVRLSNLVKNPYVGSKSYVVGVIVDGVVAKKYYESDAAKAKSLPKGF